MTDAWLKKTEMAPAIKNAGTRHNSTCSRAYHCTRAMASKMGPPKGMILRGKKKHTRNIASNNKNRCHSFILYLVISFIYSDIPMQSGKIF